MLKINSNKLKFRGKPLKECVVFLNAVQLTNGKTVKVELYPYFNHESKKEDSARNHLRHEVFYNSPISVTNENEEIIINDNWQLLEDFEIQTQGHIQFFSKPDVWEIIIQKTKDYIINLGICTNSDITQL
ncbi:MAG: hypothetical protein N4A49_01730 [Marinifilaceae bacterium]|jgi:hypothetical protein|nr:hypothetical protein [Marinifilaceae bacterium]